MSTDQSHALAKRLLDAFNKRDWDAAHDCFAPDYVNHNPPPFPGVTADREGNVRGMQTFASLAGARAEILHVVAEDDLLVVHHTVEGRHETEFVGVPASGNDVRAEFVHIFRLADGRFVERWGIVDVAGLMRQLGAAPAAAAPA